MDTNMYTCTHTQTVSTDLCGPPYPILLGPLVSQLAPHMCPRGKLDRSRHMWTFNETSDLDSSEQLSEFLLSLWTVFALQLAASLSDTYNLSQSNLTSEGCNALPWSNTRLHYKIIVVGNVMNKQNTTQGIHGQAGTCTDAAILGGFVF